MCRQHIDHHHIQSSKGESPLVEHIEMQLQIGFIILGIQSWWWGDQNQP